MLGWFGFVHRSTSAGSGPTSSPRVTSSGHVRVTNDRARAAVVSEVFGVAFTLLALLNTNTVGAQKHIFSGRPCVGCGDDPTVSGRAGAMSRDCGPGQLLLHGAAHAPLGHRLMCIPPPTVPDLFSAFADTLRLHASVFVGNATRQLFELEPTCRAAASKAALVVVDSHHHHHPRVGGGDCGSVPCRRAVDAAGFQPPSMVSTVPAIDVNGRGLGAQSYGILEDVGIDTWQPAPLDHMAADTDDEESPHHRRVAHSDSSGHQRAPAILSHHPTLSTSLRPASQLASPFVALWTTLHGKLLIIAVSISLVAAVTMLAVWISLRNRFSEPKYSEAAATEDAVSMYGRVLEEADQQRKTRYQAASSSSSAAAATASASETGNDVTVVTLQRAAGYQQTTHSFHNNNLTGGHNDSTRKHHGHHEHQPHQQQQQLQMLQHQGAYLGPDFVADSRSTMAIRQQSLRRFL